MDAAVVIPEDDVLVWQVAMVLASSFFLLKNLVIPRKLIFCFDARGEEKFELKCKHSGHSINGPSRHLVLRVVYSFVFNEPYQGCSKYSPKKFSQDRSFAQKYFFSLRKVDTSGILGSFPEEQPPGIISAAYFFRRISNWVVKAGPRVRTLAIFGQ